MPALVTTSTSPPNIFFSVSTASAPTRSASRGAELDHGIMPRQPATWSRSGFSTTSWATVHTWRPGSTTR